MLHNHSDCRPIQIGQKGKPIDWNPFKQRLQERLGYVPSLSQRLTPDELSKLGFKAAASGGTTY